VSGEFLSAFVLLFLVCDPLGNIPLVGAALAHTPPARRRAVIWREVAIAWAVLLVFLLVGQDLLRLMQISETSLYIAGGVVLFLIALRMIFPVSDGVLGVSHGGEPFIVPIAIPAIAGPSAMATVVLLASQSKSGVGPLIAASSAALLVTGVVLAAGEWLQARLGERVMLAAERLMGLVLAAISVEMMLDGLRLFVRSL
jgi:MarC family membrane protein